LGKSLDKIAQNQSAKKAEVREAMVTIKEYENE